jgi:hypothetical protein
MDGKLPNKFSVLLSFDLRESRREKTHVLPVVCSTRGEASRPVRYRMRVFVLDDNYGQRRWWSVNVVEIDLVPT